MGISHLFYPWGFILQALAIIHFIRRRPDGYWLWIILIGGALGAFIYFIAEVVPDFGLLRVSFQRAGRRRSERVVVNRCWKRRRPGAGTSPSC